MDSTSNEPKNEGFDRQVGFIEVVWFVLACAFVFLILAYWLSFKQYGWSTNPDAWGQFGDFIGGVLNPLVALAALFALVISVRMQRAELKDTRAELIEARKVAAEQAKTAEQQRREQRFFDLLNLYHRTVDSLQYTENSHSILNVANHFLNNQMQQNRSFNGKSAIKKWFQIGSPGGLITKHFEELIDNDYLDNGLVNEAFEASEMVDFAGHYLRVIIRIFGEAENLLDKEHTRYAELLRDQLNSDEIQLLTYYLWLDAEGTKSRPIAGKYGLLKYLACEKLRNKVRTIFEPEIFGAFKEAL